MGHAGAAARRVADRLADVPFVHVRSLAPDASFDAARAVRAVSAELAAATDIEERHIAVSWQYVAAIDGSVSVLAEILAPDFHPPERVERMLRSVASSVAREGGVGDADVFVEFRPARPGSVFDEGDVVRW